MKYATFDPDPRLKNIVECYWIVEGFDISWQKITPDGYPEIIFHFKDPYKIRTEKRSEELQPFSIVAGQMDRPIYLKPTGESGVFGIKFKPTGMRKVLGCKMSALYNQTLPLKDVWEQNTDAVWQQLKHTHEDLEKINIVDTFLLQHLSISRNENAELYTLIEGIQKNLGQGSILELCSKFKYSPRKIERLFQEQVGVSPKLYARIVRFNNVFKLLQKPALSKVEATYLSGYFDQAHFNKEFREFTDENPEAYFRQNHRFSNFFLNR